MGSNRVMYLLIIASVLICSLPKAEGAPSVLSSLVEDILKSVLRSESTTLYVGNLAYSVTTENLRATFGQYGVIEQASIPIDRDTGRSRGFGFVKFVNSQDATAAINALDGTEYFGRKMTVNAM